MSNLLRVPVGRAALLVNGPPRLIVPPTELPVYDPPTFPDAVDLAEAAGTRAFGSVTTAAGDYLVIEIIAEQNGAGETYPLTGGGLTYTQQTDNGTGSGHVRILQSTAPDATGGTIVVTCTPSDPSRLWHGRVTVVRGSAGPSGAAASLTTQTVSMARTGINSAVFMAVGDWNVDAVGSPTWIPGGATVASQQGSGATYILGRWDNAGAPVTEAHGISSPTYTTPSSAALEMLGILNEGDGTTFPVTQTDSTGLTDNILITLNLERTDSSGLTDNLALTRSLVTTDSANLVDSALFTQTLERTDSIGLTDTSTLELAKTVTQTDSTGLTDNVLITQSLIRTDDVGLTDTPIVLLTINRTFTDDSGLTDNVSVQLVKLVTQTDDIGPTDNILFSVQKVITDGSGLTDVVVFNQQKLVTDSSGLTDTAAIQLAKLITQSDSSGLTDNVLLGIQKVNTDSSGLTDVTTTSSTFPRTFTDSSGLIDDFAALLTKTVTQTDSSGLTDTFITQMVKIITQTDNAGLTDTTLIALVKLITINDSVGLVDTFSAIGPPVVIDVISRVDNNTVIVTLSSDINARIPTIDIIATIN